MNAIEPILQLLAIFFIIGGTAFSVIGVVGSHRLPDVYTRLHATGKVGVMGVVMLLIAAALIIPGAWAKSLVLILILLVAAPVTSHMLGVAAHRLHLKMEK